MFNIGDLVIYSAHGICKIEAELHGRKFYEQDRKLLEQTQNILFKELAITLKTSFEEINEMVIRSIKGIK